MARIEMTKVEETIQSQYKESNTVGGELLKF